MTYTEAGELAAVVAEAIGRIIDAWRTAQAGGIDPAKALAMMQAVRDGVASDRAAVDALLAAKFGGTP